MSHQHHSWGELPSTYFVQDRASRAELVRLCLQDRLLTSAMGGVLPEQEDLTGCQCVLDVGCGTGGWLVETAKTYPAMSSLVGVDISKPVLDYARAQAEAEQVGNRVRFALMDALRMLEFPNYSFDLVNQRAAVSYLRCWDWPKLLDEYRRVLRPGGVLRITEPDIVLSTSSSALIRLFQILLKAFYQAGHLFTPESDGVTSQLPGLLERYGFQQIEARACSIIHYPGTVEAAQGYENVKVLFRTALPFIEKWSRLPDNYEALYQQALEEMQRPNFVSTSRLLTVWGRNAPRK